MLTAVLYVSFITLFVAASFVAGERLSTPESVNRAQIRQSGHFETSMKGISDEGSTSTVYILAQNQYSYSATQEGPVNARAGMHNGRAPGGPPPRQPTGLLKQASSASIGVLFGILTWRSLTAYEMADSFKNGFIKTVSVAPTVGLLILNLIGFVVNWIRPLNFKNILKFILSLNMMREWVELTYNMLMVLLTDSQSAIPREIYVGRIFMNIWMTALQMAFAKSRWVSTEVFRSQLERHQTKVQEQLQLQQQQQQHQQHHHQFAQAYRTTND